MPVDSIMPEKPVMTTEEVVHAVHDVVQTIAGSESEMPVADSIQSETVNKDTPIVDAAAGIEETVAKALPDTLPQDGTTITQVPPQDGTMTTADTLPKAVDSASTGTSNDVAEVIQELADAAKAVNVATSQVNKAISDAVATIEELQATSMAGTEDPADVVNTVADTTSQIPSTVTPVTPVTPATPSSGAEGTFTQVNCRIWPCLPRLS